MTAPQAPFPLWVAVVYHGYGGKAKMRRSAQGVHVQRRNEYWDYWLATQLTPLRYVQAGQTPVIAIRELWGASQVLAQIIDSGFAGLELCHQQVSHLKKLVDAAMPQQQDPQDRTLKPWEVQPIRQALDALETALSIQFVQVVTYRVTPKGTHDVAKLIETPQETFGRYWRGMTPIAQGDWASGARCLAFELPTACGFHVVRAMEAVVVDYLKRLNKTPQGRDLGHYVELMREIGTPGEAVDIVEQIRKHHRNPLMHPEDVLDVPMAMSLYDLCRAAIISIVSKMADQGLVSITEPGEQGELALAQAATAALPAG